MRIAEGGGSAPRQISIAEEMAILKRQIAQNAIKRAQEEARKAARKEAQQQRSHAKTETADSHKKAEKAINTYNNQVEKHQKSWVKSHSKAIASMTEAQMQKAWLEDWKKSSEGQAAMKKADPYLTDYGSKVQQDLRLAGAGAGDDPAKADKAIKDRAKELRKEHGGTDADKILDEQVTDAEKLVLGESPELRDATIATMDAKEAKDKAKENAAAEVRKLEDRRDKALAGIHNGFLKQETRDAYDELIDAAKAKVTEAETDLAEAYQKELAVDIADREVKAAQKGDGGQNPADAYANLTRAQQQRDDVLAGKVNLKYISDASVDGALEDLYTRHPELYAPNNSLGMGLWTYGQSLKKRPEIDAGMDKLPEIAADSATQDWMKDLIKSDPVNAGIVAALKGKDASGKEVDLYTIKPAKGDEEELAKASPMTFAMLKYLGETFNLPNTMENPQKTDFISLGEQQIATAYEELSKSGTAEQQRRLDDLQLFMAASGDVRVEYVEQEWANVVATETPKQSLDKILKEDLEADDYNNPGYEPNSEFTKFLKTFNTQMQNSFLPGQDAQIWDAVGSDVSGFINAQGSLLRGKYDDADPHKGEKGDVTAMTGEWQKQLGQFASPAVADAVIDATTANLEPTMISQHGGGRMTDGLRLLADRAGLESAGKLADWATDVSEKERLQVPLRDLMTVDEDGTGVTLGQALIDEMTADGADEYALKDATSTYQAGVDRAVKKQQEKDGAAQVKAFNNGRNDKLQEIFDGALKEKGKDETAVFTKKLNFGTDPVSDNKYGKMLHLTADNPDAKGDEAKYTDPDKLKKIHDLKQIDWISHGANMPVNLDLVAPLIAAGKDPLDLKDVTGISANATLPVDLSSLTALINEGKNPLEALYPGTYDNLKKIRQLQDWTTRVGGENALVTFTPAIYASAKDGGVSPYYLMRVEGDKNNDGVITREKTSQTDEYGNTIKSLADEDMIIDTAAAGLKVDGENAAWQYSDFKDFQKDNTLDDKGRLYLTDSDDFLLQDDDKDGHVDNINFDGVDAAITTGWEHVRRWGDVVLGVGGLVAGGLLIFGTGGLAAPLVLLGSSAYFGFRTLEGAGEMLDHGQSLNPINTRAKGAWFGFIDPAAGGVVLGGIATVSGLAALRPLTLGRSLASLRSTATLARAGEGASVSRNVGTEFFLRKGFQKNLYRRGLGEGSKTVAITAEVSGAVVTLGQGQDFVRAWSNGEINWGDWSLQSSTWDFAMMGGGFGSMAGGYAAAISARVTQRGRRITRPITSHPTDRSTSSLILPGDESAHNGAPLILPDSESVHSGGPILVPSSKSAHKGPSLVVPGSETADGGGTFILPGSDDWHGGTPFAPVSMTNRGGAPIVLPGTGADRGTSSLPRFGQQHDDSDVPVNVGRSGARPPLGDEKGGDFIWDTDDGIRDGYGHWIDPDAAPAARSVLLLEEAAFASVYRDLIGTAPDPLLDAFVHPETGSVVFKSNLRGVDSLYRILVAHELLHKYESASFHSIASELGLPGRSAARSLSEGATEYLAFKRYGPAEFRDQQGGYAKYIASLKRQGGDGSKLAYIDETIFVERIAETMSFDQFNSAYFRGDENAIDDFLYGVLIQGGPEMLVGASPEDGNVMAIRLREPEGGDPARWRGKQPKVRPSSGEDMHVQPALSDGAFLPAGNGVRLGGFRVAPLQRGELVTDSGKRLTPAEMVLAMDQAARDGGPSWKDAEFIVLDLDRGVMQNPDDPDANGTRVAAEELALEPYVDLFGRQTTIEQTLANLTGKTVAATRNRTGRPWGEQDWVLFQPETEQTLNLKPRYKRGDLYRFNVAGHVATRTPRQELGPVLQVGDDSITMAAGKNFQVEIFRSAGKSSAQDLARARHEELTSLGYKPELTTVFNEPAVVSRRPPRDHVPVMVRDPVSGKVVEAWLPARLQPTAQRFIGEDGITDAAFIQQPGQKLARMEPDQRPFVILGDHDGIHILVPIVAGGSGAVTTPMRSISQIQEALFGRTRNDDLRKGIDKARDADRTNHFLVTDDVKDRLIGTLADAWQVVLQRSLTKPSPNMTNEEFAKIRWNRVLHDTSAKPSGMEDSDFALIRTLVSFVQANQIVMKEPRIGQSKPAPKRLYHTNEEIEAGNFTQKQAVKDFLEDLLSGAHFVAPRTSDSTAPATDLYGMFNSRPLVAFTRNVRGHSHYPGTLSYTQAGGRKAGVSMGDGIGFPNKITKDEAPESSPIVNALLVGRKSETETFFQLESWPTVRFAGLGGRHSEGYKLHQDTSWNISTYGASRYSEKLNQNRAVVLEPAPDWQSALINRARTATTDVQADMENNSTILSAFKTQIGKIVAQRAARTHDAELDEAANGYVRQSVTNAVVEASQKRWNPFDRWTTKTVVKDSTASVADDVAGTSSATDPARAAIVKRLEGLGRKERRETAQMAAPETMVQLANAVKTHVTDELLPQVKPTETLKYEVADVVAEVRPKLVAEALFSAALETGLKQVKAAVAAFEKQHPDATPHQIAHEAQKYVDGLDLKTDATALVEHWSRSPRTLPEQIATSAEMAGQHAAWEAALSSTGGDVLIGANKFAKENARAELDKAMQPLLKQLGEATKKPIDEKAALPVARQVAEDAAGNRKMRTRLRMARLHARREVRKEMRPLLQADAMAISERAVDKAFTWVIAEAKNAQKAETEQVNNGMLPASKQRSTRRIGKDVAGKARGLSAEKFVREAAKETARRKEATLGRPLTTNEQNILRAAEQIALQAVKANLGSGFTRTLRGAGRWAAEKNQAATLAYKRSLAQDHITRKVQGRGVSVVRVERGHVPLRLKALPRKLRLWKYRPWKLGMGIKPWKVVTESRVRNANVQSLTRKTTLKAARELARQPYIKQLGRTAAEQRIADSILPAVEGVTRGYSRSEALARSYGAEAARRNASPIAVVKDGVQHARTAVQTEIGERLATTVLERNFIPSPAGKVKMSPTERTVFEFMELFSRKVSYTKETYAELYELLPPERKTGPNAFPRPEDIRVDNITLMLAEVPAGLEDIIADIHAHSMGYDRRKGDYFLALLNKSGSTSRILFGSIPQYCGGTGHYSTATPSHATMVKAYKLDGRVVNDWLMLYYEDPAKAAKADLSITGVNFRDNQPFFKLPPARDLFRHPLKSAGEMIDQTNHALDETALRWSAMRQSFRDPVGYIKRMMLKHPGFFVAVGEITAIKEMVTRQLGPWTWNVGTDKFGRFLSLMNETWQIVNLHNDFGQHGKSAAGRPSPAKQGYEHLRRVKYRFSQPQFRNVQINFCHTGVGRIVRPNDDPRATDRTYKVHTYKWDVEMGEGYIAETKTVTVSKHAPEHVHQLYELFEAVPNAVADISWNDVSQAYNDMMQASPEAAKAIVQFFLDHHKHITAGSDTVKPVNEGQYNQAVVLASPLFAEIARRDGDAAYSILRGNYEDKIYVAERGVDRWTETRLMQKHAKLVGKGLGIRARKVQKKLEEMHQRRAILDEHRERMRKESRVKFNDWLARLPSDWSDSVKNNNNPGVSPALFKQLPYSTPRLAEGSAIGEGTAGGNKNDSNWRRTGAGLVSVAAVTGGKEGTDWVVDHTGKLLEPTTGGGYVPKDHGSLPADIANATAFFLRGALLLGRGLYTQKLRLAWEEIFEQGVVTRQGLDRYVSRLFNTADALGITPLQKVHISAAAEQFWANYTYLRDRPLDPDNGWTEKARFLAMHAKVGEFQIIVSREANLQDSSVNALDARRPRGMLVRAGALLTYSVNNAVALKWLHDGGFDMNVFHEMLNDPSMKHSQAAAEMSFRILFALGNGALSTREGASLIGGMFGITGTETNKTQKALQRWGMGALTAGGAAWTATDALTVVHDATQGDSIAQGVATTMLKAAFTYAAYNATKHELNAAHARPMEGPLAQEKPGQLMAGALMAAMVVAGVDAVSD